MSDTAIRVEGLSKQYRIGGKPRGYKTLRDVLSETASKPIRAARALLNRKREDSTEGLFWALKDVSFDVKHGDVVGIVGRNGAGKSTLLKVLSRITEPTEGYAEIAGRVGSLLEVGTGFHPELTGRENIHLNGAILGMKRAEIAKKFDEIVAFAEIEKFIDTPVKHYSSGMYLRLAFSVAAQLEPEILLIDEVLAVGDAAFQKKCLGKMGEVANKGRTVFFVSHNLAAVAQLCRKAIWLDRGKLRKIGTPSEVITSYLAEDSKGRAERRWNYPGDAPGDERVRLLAGRALQQGQVADVVDINVPIEIEIDFLVQKDASNLISGISIYTAEGLCAFNSCDWRPSELRAGKYRKRVTLPAPLLSEGRFDVLIQLVFFGPDIRSVVARDALSFEGVDSNHPLSVRGNYKGQWPGVLRLRLQWDEATPLAWSGERQDIVARERLIEEQGIWSQAQSG